MNKMIFFCLLAIIPAFGLISCDFANHVIVTFDLDGGNINGNIASVNFIVKPNETIVNLPNPSKEGNIFGGWITAQDGLGSEFTTSTKVESNIIVFAKWSIDEDFYNEILKLVYDSNYWYPDGFYQDVAFLDPEYCSVEPGYRSPYYLHTANFEPRDEKNLVWVELHTLDKKEARNWSNSTIENSNLDWYKKMIQEKENETEKYFEFVLVTNGFSRLNRVHRSDYFIPLFDKMNFIPHFNDFKEDYTVGIYNGDLEIKKVKELIEYLWCRSLLMNGPVVVSTISEEDGKFKHYIQSLEIIGGDWEGEEVYVYDNKFILDKKTKVLTFVERRRIGKMPWKRN